MATAGRTTKLDDDFTVSAIGFGAGALASGYGDVDDAESLATLNRCLDLGVTFIDTANVYGGGNNERLIAKLLADRRDEVTLATKFGIASNLSDRAADLGASPTWARPLHTPIRQPLSGDWLCGGFSGPLCRLQARLRRR